MNKPVQTVSTMLNDIAGEINEIVDATVNTVVEAKLQIGKRLIEARSFFQSEAQFHEWREANTVIKSRPEAAACMRIAERFGDMKALTDKVGWSVLRELAYAPQSAVKQIVEEVEQGKEHSARETRATVRHHEAMSDAREAASDARTREVEADVRTTRPKAKEAPSESMEDKAKRLVRLPLEIRCQEENLVYDTIGNSLLALGLDPLGTYNINPETIGIIADGLLKEYKDTEFAEVLDYVRASAGTLTNLNS